jgi:hypothetical protein
VPTLPNRKEALAHDLGVAPLGKKKAGLRRLRIFAHFPDREDHQVAIQGRTFQKITPVP